MNKMNPAELVSALADGQLDGEQLAQGMAALAGDPQAREAWRMYHLIGDVLRSPDLAAGATRHAFVERLSSRLAAESSAPAAAAERPRRFFANLAAARARPANDPVFRWKVAAGFAGVAAAASIGWMLLTVTAREAPSPQLAAAPVSQGPVMIRDSRLDEMLAAHQQLGGSSALQMPAAFVRQATFDTSAGQGAID